MDEFFWLALLRKWVYWLAASPCRWLLPVLAVFVAFPSLDLVVSGWFFVDGHFFLRHYRWFEFVRAVVPPLTLGCALFASLLGIAAKVFHEPFLGIEPRKAVYLLVSLVIGPGLLANSLLKEHWGRARPSAIMTFGGDRAFTPALVMSDQCIHNCSFVSGHAALAFWTVAFALLIRRPWRRMAVAVTLLYGVLVGFVRVAQGSHFLSDVVFAAALSVGVVYSLHRLILRPSPSQGKEPAFQAAWSHYRLGFSHRDEQSKDLAAGWATVLPPHRERKRQVAIPRCAAALRETLGNKERFS